MRHYRVFKEAVSRELDKSIQTNDARLKCSSFVEKFFTPRRFKFVRSFVRSFIYAFIHSLTYLFVHWYFLNFPMRHYWVFKEAVSGELDKSIQTNDARLKCSSFVEKFFTPRRFKFVRSFVRSFIYAFIHSLTHLFVHWYFFFVRSCLKITF